MSLDGITTSAFGLCWITIGQINGRFKTPGSKHPNKQPYFFIYILTNIIILSTVGHKEQRFLTAILPLFHVCWAFLVVELVKIIPALKKVFRLIFMVYATHDFLITVKFQLNYNSGAIEIYNLLHGRSPLLTDYSQYIEQ